MTSLNVIWKTIDKMKFTVKQKGLKRITSELDIAKFVRRLFITNLIQKNIIKKDKRILIRNHGKFVIDEETVTLQNLTSEDSDDIGCF